METKYASLRHQEGDYNSFKNMEESERNEIVRGALPVRNELKGHLVDSAP